MTESERAADALGELGLTATTSAFGAKSVNKADWSSLSGREVFLVQDKGSPNENESKAGLKYLRMAFSCLKRLEPAAKIKLLKLPNSSPTDDVVECLRKRREAGQTDPQTKAEIEGLCSEAPLFQSCVRPVVFLPGGADHVRISDAAHELGDLLGKNERLYFRSGNVVEVHLGRDGKPP